METPHIEVEMGEPQLTQIHELDTEGLTLPEPEMEENSDVEE